MTMDLGDRTAFASLTWCAGVLAHEACHSKLYWDCTRAWGRPAPIEVYGLGAGELSCGAFQMRVLQQVGAPRSEIEWVQQQGGGHYDKDGDGDFDEDDYRLRDY